ncbi:MAG: patatin-like phospholipase family protein [Acidobacteria bacterium]|nr:patatin-like phospholipase family protein [Acidobacteriota bacterium]
MTGREPYSSKHRTALVLAWTGSAGAYHAGVLRALAEAGVRIDLVAGRGIGTVSAFFSAIEGGARLWSGDGLWRQPAVASFFPWRRSLRLLGWAGAAALAVVLVPLALLAVGLVVYPAAFVLRLAHLAAANALADGFTSLVREAFLPDRLPAWLAEVSLLLTFGVLLLILRAARRRRLRGRHRERGRFWWRVFSAPISNRESIRFWQAALWRLITGGTRVPEPDPLQLSRDYAELLVDNLGQPGFRELIVLVHDVDIRRDLVMAALTEPYRQAFFGRRTGAVTSAQRSSETLDFTGADRDHVVDVLAASQCLPIFTDPWPVTFAPESYWRGETHRLCDRPEGIGRLLEEVLAAGADQVIVVSAVGGADEPHTLTEPRVDGRGRVGEWLAAQETAAVRDAVKVREASFRGLHQIRPDHNPLGPFDLDGAYDERSDRVQLLRELIDRGYADAYHQFIEPVVGAAEPTP